MFKAVAGGRVLPLKRVRELWCIIGRRGGKSRMAAALACYFALFVKHKLSGGERGMVLVLAATVEQAKVVFDYVLAFLNSSSGAAEGNQLQTTRSEIRLKNGINIAIHANSFRSVRGRTLCACIFDEVEYWRDDKTAHARHRGLSRCAARTAHHQRHVDRHQLPYRKIGLMYAKHKRFFGIDSDDTLVVQGPTLAFNKTLDADAIAAQQQADPDGCPLRMGRRVSCRIVGFLDDELIELPSIMAVRLSCRRASGILQGVR